MMAFCDSDDLWSPVSWPAGEALEKRGRAGWETLWARAHGLASLPFLGGFI